MEKCVEGMSEMYAHMKLMDIENADLRKQAFERTTKKKAVYFEGAHLMTSLEMLDPKQLSGNDSDVPEDKCIIASILGHQWSWGVLVFEVAWEDGDVTWQNLESVDDCLALDVYLQRRGVERPQDLV
ncbi:hypothetical protein D9758_018545 [Tetrapyrgos nigripes]|uniref:Chromo domain-containing protein n=1 Tax=Tetrapyrgos nigripes TaxID=182062 RepID=A0A8H5B7J5_9AGAR|nr:hypothetical protein D9758_018547 [Tetrapyrgos nigripes]KAF5318214.1 hypothetical protein D9758_018545 [Tetrapyrgos nigripes]